MTTAVRPAGLILGSDRRKVGHRRPLRAVHSMGFSALWRQFGTSELVVTYGRDEPNGSATRPVSNASRPRNPTGRLPFLSRELLLVAVLLVLGTMVGGILSELESSSMRPDSDWGDTTR